MGLNSSWELLDSLTPAVPFFKRLVNHIEKSFGLEHSTKHTIPSPETGICEIMKMAQDACINDYVDGRIDPAKTNLPKDVIALGATSLQESKYLEELFEDRWSHIANMSTE